MHLRARWLWQPNYTIALLKKNRHEWVTDNYRRVPLTTFYWSDSKIAFIDTVIAIFIMYIILNVM